MNAFQIVTIILTSVIPVILVIGFYSVVKIDIAKLQIQVEFLIEQIQELKKDVKQINK
jgi:hypothetical protein